MPRLAPPAARSLSEFRFCPPAALRVTIPCLLGVVMTGFSLDTVGSSSSAGAGASSMAADESLCSAAEEEDATGAAAAEEEGAAAEEDDSLLGVSCIRLFCWGGAGLEAEEAAACFCSAAATCGSSGCTCI